VSICDFARHVNFRFCEPSIINTFKHSQNENASFRVMHEMKAQSGEGSGELK
jgi:hypothetical protein